MLRRKYFNKEIESALRYAELHGWRIEVGGGHAWGRMYCPMQDLECRCGEFCLSSIWSTPKNTRNHARQILRIINNCYKIKLVKK